MSDKHLLQELSRADYITVASFVVIANAYWLLFNGQLHFAISLAFVSMYLDYVDGRVARKFGGSDYGKVLDSLYDILGWVLFPSLVVNLQTDWAWWSILITTAFIVASALRLSRFTVKGYLEKKTKFYVGMPVSYSRYALLLAFIADGAVSAVLISIMIPLMVSSRPFRKSPPFLMQINLLYAVLFLWLHLH